MRNRLIAMLADSFLASRIRPFAVPIHCRSRTATAVSGT